VHIEHKNEKDECENFDGNDESVTYHLLIDNSSYKYINIFKNIQILDIYNVNWHHGEKKFKINLP
jgi:hypothetical protein